MLGILVGLVGVSTIVGIAWRTTTGRVRRSQNDQSVVDIADLDPDARAGAGATLLQFSTEVCAPCHATRALLATIAKERTGVSHVDFDVTTRADVANRFHLLQSPTTFILDARGVVRARIGGTPRPAEIIAELDRILGTARTIAA
ncbi:MAG: hypothetical protein JWO10_2135 [Microbacteriaceae bacterium]|nr:hypothetical protein [Microbacteriaceae bacterium]